MRPGNLLKGTAELFKRKRGRGFSHFLISILILLNGYFVNSKALRSTMAVGGNSWNVWLRLSRVQLRQITKSLDRTLVGLSHGRFPLQNNHNIFATWWRSLFDASVAFRRANRFTASPLTRRGVAGFDRLRPAANVSRFATLPRCPKVPPGACLPTGIWSLQLDC